LHQNRTLFGIGKGGTKSAGCCGTHSFLRADQLN
jgi:hypothetical protein